MKELCTDKLILFNCQAYNNEQKHRQYELKGLNMVQVPETPPKERHTVSNSL